MNPTWATVMVNGYGYVIKDTGHGFSVSRAVPGGRSSAGLSSAETFKLLADIAALAEPEDRWEKGP